MTKQKAIRVEMPVTPIYTSKEHIAHLVKIGIPESMIIRETSRPEMVQSELLLEEYMAYREFIGETEIMYFRNSASKFILPKLQEMMEAGIITSFGKVSL